MVPETTLNALAFLDRPTLECLQITSRLLRDLVDGNAHSLPLRCIADVQIINGNATLDFNGQVISFPEAWRNLPRPVYFANKFIRLLTFDFHPETLFVPQFLLANATTLQCRIGGLRVIYANIAIDYALLDALVTTFRPKHVVVAMDEHLDEDYAMLFTHRVLHGRIERAEFELFDNVAPACIVPGLIGPVVPRTCGIETYVYPVPWIANFIQALERVERGTRVPQTITLIHARYEKRMPLPLTTEPLNGVQFVYARAPHSDFVKTWLQNDVHEGGIPKESPVAKLYAFKDVMPGTSLDVFMWTLRQPPCLAFINSPSLHYAFYLSFRPSSP